jgi:hypothetical protein
MYNKIYVLLSIVFIIYIIYVIININYNKNTEGFNIYIKQLYNPCIRNVRKYKNEIKQNKIYKKINRFLGN